MNWKNSLDRNKFEEACVATLVAVPRTRREEEFGSIRNPNGNSGRERS